MIFAQKFPQVFAATADINIIVKSKNFNFFR